MWCAGLCLNKLHDVHGSYMRIANHHPNLGSAVLLVFFMLAAHRGPEIKKKSKIGGNEFIKIVL